MPRNEDDLLARLNALKPSSITLDSKADFTSDLEISTPQSVSERLAERLKSLRAGVAGPARPDDAKVAGRVPPGRHPDGFRVTTQPAQSHLTPDTGSDGIEEQSLEDLLEELGPDDQWNLDPDDPKHISSLLEEARAALPSEQSSTQPDGHDAHSSDVSHNFGNGDGDDPDSENQEGNDQRDDDEADDYVKQILAELEYEKKYGIEEDEQNDQTGVEEQSDPAQNGLQLPSTPSNVLQPAPPTAEPPSYEDSELEARFSKLGLNLPSTPTASPSARAKAAANAGLKKSTAKSNFPTYTNEDIESWCCICNEDGEVKCLGCDGDIYCHSCWNEGHGTAPSQERGHKAVQFTRKGPAATAA